MSTSKKSGSHGTHWSVVSEDFEVVKGIVGKTIENGELLKKFDFSGSMLSGELAILEKRFGGLLVTALTLNGEIGTAFPSIESEICYDGTVKKVEEWANEVEAQVDVKLSNAHFSFFALDYAQNKGMYVPENSVKVCLTGFAYGLHIGNIAGTTLKDGKKIADDFTGVFPAKIAMPKINFDIDEYQIYGLVEEIEKANFAGQNGLILKTKIAGANDWKIVIDLGVFAKNIRGETPKTGDKITATIWLAGRLKK